MQTHIDKTIVVSEGETLKLRNGDSIVSDSDIDMILVMPDGRVEGNGATIRNTNPDCNKAKIKLDHSEPITTRHRLVMHTHISCVVLKGFGNEPDNGVGLHLFAGSKRNAVQGVTFRDIGYYGLNTAIYGEIVGEGGISYINSNIHDGIMIDDCVHGIVHSRTGIESNGAGFSQNWYTNMHVQSGRKMVSAIDIDEVNRLNYFSGVIWDWKVAEGEYPINSTGVANNFAFPNLWINQFNISDRDKILLARDS